jgi:phosphoesterase RecJ-like protein
MFRTTPVKTLKVWGRILENTRVNEDGVTVSVITGNDLEELNASADDASGIVDMLNSVPGSKYTVLLHEDKNGKVKGSFRTQSDEVDVANIAEQFGGGGHRKAAGFTMPGRIKQEIHWKIEPADEINTPTSLPKSL